MLGRGELAHALTLDVHHVTAGAKTKIEAAGGTISIVAPRHRGPKPADKSAT